jgi:hypothetical protein
MVAHPSPAYELDAPSFRGLIAEGWESIPPRAGPGKRRRVNRSARRPPHPPVFDSLFPKIPPAPPRLLQNITHRWRTLEMSSAGLLTGCRGGLRPAPPLARKPTTCETSETSP